MTRETVALETPASFATSLIDMMCDPVVEARDQAGAFDLHVDAPDALFGGQLRHDGPAAHQHHARTRRLRGIFAILTETGFVIAFGVLLDTFIVRSVLVPALTLDKVYEGVKPEGGEGRRGR